MPGLIRIIMVFAACGASLFTAAAAAPEAHNAPTGAWRTSNQCFLAAFLLTEDGRAETIYLTGETDASAAWTWDGSTLRITSKMFDLDSFTGRIKADEIEADYVWHDLDKDELHKQACVFERLESTGA